jgi:hypothetical protein
MMQINMPSLELGGTQEEQALANQVWNLMRMRGFSYAMTRPISLTLEQLAEYFAGQKYQGLEKPEEVAPLIDKALSSSPAVFLREETPLTEEETDGVEENQSTIPLVNYKTTKSGKAPSSADMDQHSFKTRLFQDAKPVTPASEEEEAVRAPEQIHHTSHAISLPVAATPAQAQPAPAPAPVQPQRPAAPVPTGHITTPQPLRPITQAPVQPAPTQPQRPVVQAPAAQAQPAPAPTRPPVQAPAPQVQPQPAPAPVIAGPLEIEIADGLQVDINRPITEVMAEYGDYFASALVPALEEDFRFINFANNWYLEEITGRYNKGDFRRIREYMQDNEGPVSDTAIMADLWGKRTTDLDYEATRFALNFRLYKEKKDFEFVGAADDRVWTAPGLPQIGNPRHKATEIGTDYKYLEDPQLVDPSEITEENGLKVWRHMLTFYEYENGVLPYNATAHELFPAPLLDEQKSLVLRFEAPQLYFTYTAELRYPTGSRGGWIGGLEQFFEENLVPGAILVIRQGEKSNHFTIEYEQSEEQNANVLFYDERRQKFVFRPIVFACEIIAEGLLTPDRYAKLNGQKRLEDSDRKKTDQVIATAFEYAGQKSSQGYYALLDDLYPVANIERPFSRNYMRHLLTHGNSMFQPDETTPDAFYYKPPQSGFRR